MRHLRFLLIAMICISALGCRAKQPSAVEIASIEFRSSGCFHQVYERLRLIKTGNVVVATLQSVERSERKQLNAGQLKAFYTFIQELKNVKEVNGCTTVSSYKATVGNEHIERTDGGCSWNGFHTLRSKLFN